MVKLTASTVINKAIGDIFKYLASPYSSRAFIPYLKEKSNIQPEVPGKGQKFDWTYSMFGEDLKGSAIVSVYDQPNNYVIETSGDIVSSWIFSLLEENGGVKVVVEINYEIVKNRFTQEVNQKLVDSFNQKALEQILEILKINLES